MHEPWIERVIRQAQEAGAFDDVEGTGKPIPSLAKPYESSWWARNWIGAEQDRERTIELARLVARELPRILSGDDEDEVRAGLESLNTKIGAQSSNEGNGLPLLDVDRLMKERAIRRSGR